jgi:type VI secretion system protein VasJ
MDLLMLGKNPVHPEHPTGSDARYDPDFEMLQAEIEKLSSPTATEGVNWQKVSDAAARILAEKSKDLMAASYLAVSQTQLNKMKGFAVGVTVLRDLMATYWEDLYPPKKRMRGRAGAISFWAEKTEAQLDGMDTAVDRETLSTASDVLSDLDELLAANFPDPPLLTTIRRRVDELLGRAKQSETEGEGPGPAIGSASSHQAPDSAAAHGMPEKKENGASPETRKPPSVSAVPTSDAEAMASEQDAMKHVNAALLKIRQAGAFLFETDPTNPHSYRLRRMAAWAKVSSLPPADDGKTRIPSPSAQEMEALEVLKGGGNRAVLLETVEQKLSRYIFWFDLCRLSAEALEGLGTAHEAARQAVCDETAFFIHRHPGIETLSFSDGIPFADPQTRQWLQGIALGVAAEATGSSASANIAAAPCGEEDAGLMAKAEALAVKKKIPDAVALIQERMRSSISGKDALSWRMALCRLLLRSKFKTLAVPHLDQVLSDIDTYRLETWEPELALSGLTLAWTGYRALADNRFAEQVDQLLNRISRLSPTEALRISR